MPEAPDAARPLREAAAEAGADASGPGDGSRSADAAPVDAAAAGPTGVRLDGTTDAGSASPLSVAPAPEASDLAAWPFRETEAQLREGYRIARMGRWELDIRGGRLWWSDGIFELFEIVPGSFEASYEAFLRLVHPADRDRVDRTFHNSIVQRQPYETTHRLLMPDGRVKWMMEVGRTEYDADGTPLRAVGIVQDVTARREAEESLRESEMRLRLALHAASQGLFDRNVETGEETASDEFLALLGLDPREALGRRSWTERVHPDDRDQAERRYAAYLAGELPEYRVETRQRMADGQWKWVLSLGSIVEWSPDGRPRRMLGTYTDIDDRKRTEEALERRILALTGPPAATGRLSVSDLFDVDELQHIQDAFARATGVASGITAPDGTRITRPSNNCRLCVEVIRGTAKGEVNCLYSDSVLGRHNPSGPIVQRCLSAGLWDAGASITVGGQHVANLMIGQVMNEEVDVEAMRAYARSLGADMNEFESALAEVPVMSRERFESVAQAVFILARELSLRAYQNVQQARFIAERRRADEERTRLQGQLLQARKLEAVGRLAGGVAHDLNNMLAPVLGYGELLTAELEEADPRRAMAAEIVSAAVRARDLVRQLLAFGRQQMIELQPLDLNRVVAGIEKILRRTIREDIALDIRLGRDIGLVKADPIQVEQVILNLAMNAQDAMPAGGRLTIETAAIELTAADAQRDPDVRPGTYARLSVHDTGAGMDADTLQRIFDPFFTTKAQGKGTGLGLATVHGIVKQHGGTIEVTSQPGSGTTFHACFPRVEAATPLPARPAESPVLAGRGTVLVVEDQEQVREMVCRVLRRAGHHVLQAPNGEGALEAAAAHDGPIDLLLTDVIMTSMNGRELYERISEVRPGLRVLFMSGYSSDIVSLQGVLEGGVNFIQKPFSVGDIVAQVRRVLEGA